MAPSLSVSRLAARSKLSQSNHADSETQKDKLVKTIGESICPSRSLAPQLV
jgi:hypothetical protein